MQRKHKDIDTTILIKEMIVILAMILKAKKPYGTTATNIND